jgi:hydroxymethylbilane synthase
LKIKIGTRASRLAMWQAHYIQQCLEKAGAETEIIAIETKGDKVLNVALSKIGSKGVFTEEFEEMLLTGEIHIAVHSAKDLQSDLGDEFEIVAFTEREKPNDVLISDKAIDLSQPLTIGSSSVRRVAFFKRYYPHINLVNIRGNLQTRIAKMREGQCDALMLAFAGVNRMEYNDLIVHEFPVEEFIPPVGQGTVAVQIAANLDSSVKDFVKNACNNSEVEVCLRAERAFLATMKGGCSIPVFGHAKKVQDIITIKAGIVSLDGSEKILIESTQLDSETSFELGERVALEVLANGGKEILDQIKISQ